MSDAPEAAEAPAALKQATAYGLDPALRYLFVLEMPPNASLDQKRVMQEQMTLLSDWLGDIDIKCAIVAMPYGHKLECVGGAANASEPAPSAPGPGQIGYSLTCTCIEHHGVDGCRGREMSYDCVMHSPSTLKPWDVDGLPAALAAWGRTWAVLEKKPRGPRGVTVRLALNAAAPLPVQSLSEAFALAAPIEWGGRRWFAQSVSTREEFGALLAEAVLQTDGAHSTKAGA